MPFLVQGKTNWKFVLIVIILASIVSGGLLYWQHLYFPEEEMELLKQEENLLILGDSLIDDLNNIKSMVGVEDI